jgi:hypothetical protein
LNVECGSRYQHRADGRNSDRGKLAAVAQLRGGDAGFNLLLLERAMLSQPEHDKGRENGGE